MGIINKKINLNLVGLGGNAFVLLGAFIKKAKQEGWTDEEVKAVTKEAKSGDYDHLLRTLDDHCEPEDNE